MNVEEKLRVMKEKLSQYPLNIIKFHNVEIEDFDIDAFYLEFFTDPELKDFFEKIFTEFMETYSFNFRLSMKNGNGGRTDFSIWFYKEKILDEFVGILEERF